MCDTLCALGPQGTIFAKNSDRPPEEVQLVAFHGRRPAGGELRTQYVRIPDQGAAASLLARPTWLWGAEHGINEHRVAVGNEKIYTSLDPATQPNGLIGMDLVRLALERSSSADEALEIVTGLLSELGQGGIGDAAHHEAYFSSFLLADPRAAWVLETAGRSWAAKPVHRSAAISNRISLRSDWTRASADLAPGDDFDLFRLPEQLTGDADIRLEAATTFLDDHPFPHLTPGAVAAHLRDHGHGPWGEPGSGGPPDPPPAELRADFTGISTCMHVRGYMATTSSMVALLPAEPDRPLQAWVAPGSPCVSVYVPVLLSGIDGGAGVTAQLHDETLWHRFEKLRHLVEMDPERIYELRQALDPIEEDLWDEAASLVDHQDRWSVAAEGWGRRVACAAEQLTRDL
ncbi:MAG: C69 family dipeptidase [Actinomycetota bacterium]|nr:C69 family dipeptidase [Actinomycetota bacterium]